MLNKRIIYTQLDGTIAVVVPSERFLSRFDDEDKAYDAVIAKSIPEKYVEFGGQVIPIMKGESEPVGATVVHTPEVKVCIDTDIPVDRHFREAWELDLTPSEDVVTVNMEKAREIHMNYLRNLRRDKFPSIDAAYNTALDKNDMPEVAKLSQLRKTLRDIPQTFDLSSARTPDELKLLIPDELKD